MLDLHVLTGGGSTSLTNVNTIPANDGVSTAGFPETTPATLVAWGALTTIADTLNEVKLNSQDLGDNQNGEDWVAGSALSGIKAFIENLPYVQGQRQISVKQNTAGANELVFLLDSVPGKPSNQQGYPNPTFPNNIPPGQMYRQSTVFSGALTAITWGTVTFAPTNPMPAGRYAILGAEVSSLTNYALIRFLHGDFGSANPGFPVIDPNVAIARAVTPLDALTQVLLQPGYQFSVLSALLKVPCEPIFTYIPGASGLRYQVMDITTDTPQVNVNLVKVG